MNLLLGFLFSLGSFLLLDLAKHLNALLDELGHRRRVIDVRRSALDIEQTRQTQNEHLLFVLGPELLLNTYEADDDILGQLLLIEILQSFQLIVNHSRKEHLQ